MTRNEEILSEVQKRFSSNDTHLVSKISTFIDGAKWADKTMIEKVMNWLDSIDMDMRYWNSEEGVLQGQFMDDLLKVMEK